MCRDGCHHSPPSPLRDLLLAIAIFLAILPFAGAPIYRRLHRQIERTQFSWPVHSTSQPTPTAATSTSTEFVPSPGDTTPTLDSWLPLLLGCLATLAIFALWYRMLGKAQSLHPRTRGYPNYNSPHGGSAL